MNCDTIFYFPENAYFCMSFIYVHIYVGDFRIQPFFTKQKWASYVDTTPVSPPVSDPALETKESVGFS